ncbi:hypothetical protein BBO_07262 [Beauveria brongniartii RCEF 3172]|uniref:Uncharacterized protein n=1 Tax=Beauveria brongniartii RCEF 3172 TaxID=1081107 RepID=A0A162JBR3_9HYPO|nr:hypothetical protein BBO_07262 [Beauveria brongniartii RCEF 3172]
MVSTNFDSISESRHRWVQGGESRARLYDRGDTAGDIMRGKKLKALQPAKAHQDPYIRGLLIALAQAQRRQAAAPDDGVARWRLCLLALPGAGARQLFCYRGWLPAAMPRRLDEPSAEVACPRVAIEVGTIDLTTRRDVARRVWELLREEELV